MKKRYIILIVITLFIGVSLFFLSSIARWYVEKNSRKLVGRRVTIGQLHFNYLRVSVQVKNFVMYETSATDTFASFSELYINFDPWALLKKEYAFSEIRLANPKVTLIQNGGHFNFDDLMHSGDTVNIRKNKDTIPSNVRFLVKNISLTGGLLSYTDQQVKNHIALRNLNLEIPMIAWNSNQSDMGISFRIGERGVVKLDANVNNQNQLYSVTMNTKDIDLNMFTNYLKSYLKISSLKGYLTSDIAISGSLRTPANATIRGTALVNELSMTDTKSSSIFSAKRISASLKNIDLGKFDFAFSGIAASDARLLAILNKNKSNLMDFLDPYFISDSISRQHVDSTKIASSTPVKYSVDTIRLENSIITFQDNTLNRPFSYDLKNINLTMSGLTESATRVPMLFSVNLNDKGTLKGTYDLNMVDFMSFKTHMTISKLDLTSFSPYSEYYIASPIIQGLFTYDLSLEMSKARLNNKNKVSIDAIKFGKRTHDKTAVKAPVRLALYILKDTHDKITFELPVEGNPSEPKFSLSKIIWKTVGNFCVKVASEPFKAMSGLVTAKPEDIDKMPFQPAQDTLSAENLKTVHMIAELLRKKEGLKFMFVQHTNTDLEKEQIAILLAKEQFIRTKNPGADSSAVAALTQKLSLTNDEFKAFLASKIENGAAMETPKACVALVGDARLENELLQKINRRNWSLQKALGLDEKLPEEAFRIETADLRNIPEELKKPMFKVEVALSE
jgi:hypothetical protein